jgi:hypothetical protein
MASTDDDVLAVVGLLLATDCFKPKIERQSWCKEWLRKRNIYSRVNLLSELKLVPKDWRKIP